MNRGSIVVVGFGWVGQANALALTAMGYSVSYFDIGSPEKHYNAYKDLYERVPRWQSVLEADSAETCYVVCVGDRVSEAGAQDIGAIRSALDSLKSAKGVIVLRSTVLPDHLETLKFDYYVPEFLHEKYAVEECVSPYFVVVGKSATKKLEPTFFNAWRRRTPRLFDGTPREAAFVKYLSNLWNATRVAFVNEFGDTITEPKSPADVDTISRVMNFVLMSEPYQRYGRGFDGHCLPKDMRAFTRWYKGKNKNVALLEGAYRSNEAHITIEKSHPSLPKWFAEWGTPHLSGVVALREFLYSIGKNIRDPREFIQRRILRRDI